ncbi:hypothetical protein HK097_010998 [Rhizophlyctis rosea]|uniref:Uncharacterized protein n=1 Tax=Rhizophlyctis rosea TaxID=64517 RepID=A0AAD5X262_9FUNG|nr:hypothetical protein HK097_010998 [Rhizophlyctis rosea]
MPFTPTAPVFIPNVSANDMFARSPSPPRNMGSGMSLEQLPEVQMMMQMQEKVGSPAASVPVKSTLKNALGPAKRDVRREVRDKKHVQFREFVIVAHTHSPDEYDRSSLQVSPLTQEDVTELLAYRAEMHATTSVLVRIRQHAIEEQIRLKRQQQQQRQQQQLAAMQFYQTTTSPSPSSKVPAYPTTAWGDAAFIPTTSTVPSYAPHPATSHYGFGNFHHHNPAQLGQPWRTPMMYH